MRVLVRRERVGCRSEQVPALRSAIGDGRGRWWQSMVAVERAKRAKVTGLPRLIGPRARSAERSSGHRHHHTYLGISKAMSTVSQIQTLMDSVSDIRAGKWPWGSLFWEPCCFLAFLAPWTPGDGGGRAMGVGEGALLP